MTKRPRYVLVRFTLLIVVNILLVLIVSTTSVSAQTKLVSKGGVLYPRTGDYNQVRYIIPKEAREVLRPGMLLGVLPANCNSAAGPEGNYYICHHGIYLQPYFYGDKVAYAVLKIE
jgi:hypothetical protein